MVRKGPAALLAGSVPAAAKRARLLAALLLLLLLLLGCLLPAGMMELTWVLPRRWLLLSGCRLCQAAVLLRQQSLAGLPGTLRQLRLWRCICLVHLHISCRLCWAPTVCCLLHRLLCLAQLQAWHRLALLQLRLRRLWSQLWLGLSVAAGCAGAFEGPHGAAEGGGAGRQAAALLLQAGP